MKGRGDVRIDWGRLHGKGLLVDSDMQGIPLSDVLDIFYENRYRDGTAWAFEGNVLTRSAREKEELVKIGFGVFKRDKYDPWTIQVTVQINETKARLVPRDFPYLWRTRVGIFQGQPEIKIGEKTTGVKFDDCVAVPTGNEPVKIETDWSHLDRRQVGKSASRIAVKYMPLVKHLERNRIVPTIVDEEWMVVDLTRNRIVRI